MHECTAASHTRITLIPTPPFNHAQPPHAHRFKEPTQATKPRMEVDNPISDPAALEGALRAAVVTGAGQQQDYARALAVAEAAELLIQVTCVCQ